MDPLTVLSVTASIIACIQLTDQVLKRVGPSSRNKDDLNSILETINGFRQSYDELKAYFNINEEDEIRLSAFQHLEEPLAKCKEALETVRKRLDGLTFIGRNVVGRVWDDKFKKCLERLSGARELLNLAMGRDQSYVRTLSYFLQANEFRMPRIVLSAVERYLRNIAEDVRDVQIDGKRILVQCEGIETVINENGKRVLDLSDGVRAIKRHDGEWRSEENQRARGEKQYFFAQNLIDRKILTRSGRSRSR